MSDPKLWWDGLPLVTKTFFGGMFAVTVAANFGILPPMMLILDFDLVWRRFQVWRLFTSVFFYGKLGFPFLTWLYFLYSYSLRLEQEHFSRRTADYIYAVLIVWMVMLVIGYVFDLMLINVPMILAIVYIWSSANQELIVNFWFGITFQAMYFPWVLLAFGILTGQSNGMPELMGIFAGHCYFFLKTKYPRDFGGPDLLETPQFLRNLFPEEERERARSFGVPPGARAGNDGGAPRFGGWGQGRRLGD
mmetsp:Transcript_41008/g.57096  ORF Transcript_41008/g.57096 Transcript_41008/m.57096 type:complete len:248 (+) Transcript_41008:138-881(+)